MFGYIKGKIALDKVQQARKNFKIIATEERPEHSLSSTQLKQRAGEFLWAEVRTVLGHLWFLVGLIWKKSQLSPFILTGGSFTTWSKELIAVRLLQVHREWEAGPELQPVLGQHPTVYLGAHGSALVILYHPWNMNIWYFAFTAGGSMTSLCLFLLPLSGIPGALPEAGAKWWGASPFREVEAPPKGRALRPLCSCSHRWLFPWLYFKEMTPKSFRQTFLGGKTGKKLLGRFTYQRGKERVHNHTFSNVNSVGKGMLGYREDHQAFSQTNLVDCLGHLPHLRIYVLLLCSHRAQRLSDYHFKM